MWLWSVAGISEMLRTRLQAEAIFIIVFAVDTVVNRQGEPSDIMRTVAIANEYLARLSMNFVFA